MQIELQPRQMSRRSPFRAAARLLVLPAVVGLFVGTASGVTTGKFTATGTWPTNVTPQLDITLLATDPAQTEQPVEEAYTPHLNQMVGLDPWLRHFPAIKSGQAVQFDDPPRGFNIVGRGISWTEYDGFTGRASDIRYTGWFFHSMGGVTAEPNSYVNFEYTRRWKPCLTLGLDYSFCNANKIYDSQPLAAGGTQGVVGPAAADMASQWAFKKLGLPLALPPDSLRPVTVAVIDSGLDYRHPHLKPANIWRNPAPGADPKFPNDLLGWNFIGNNNRPWDDYGHGTFVAGLITAVNPAAKIMSLKVLDQFGNGPLSAVAQAIVYAVDRGARVINLSAGSRGVTQVEEVVVDYARARGAIIVVAAGNEAIDTAKFGPTAVPGVFGVAATDPNDRRPPFGNWGQQVALAAPGVDIVSLRARATDFVLVATLGKDYTPGANIVGADKWLFRATGTSFSAPLAAGAASLLLSRNPTLTNSEVERMLVESADDIETPGWDQYTGAGRLNIARALRADPAYYLTAKVSKVEAGRVSGQPVVNVFGTAEGSQFKRYEVQLGQGETPSSWKTVARNTREVDDDALASIPIKEITARGKWSIRVLVSDGSKTKEARGSLNVQ